LLDRHFPVHGNWLGLSLGWVTTLWLTHLLSEGDHRLNQVEPWALAHLQTLRACTGQCVYQQDLTDDRLAAVLDALAHNARWAQLETALTQGLVRTYALKTAVVRVDATTASSERPLSPEGLFQFGHSKDQRPDCPQLKINLATLDPLGLPLVTTVVAGNEADDPLYLPAIKQVQSMLGQGGRLYVGDAKMAALETRQEIARGGDYYLCPLPAQQVDAAQWDAYLAPVWAGQQPLAVLIDPEPGEAQPPAEGFTVQELLGGGGEGAPWAWTERRLLVRCPAQAQNEAATLRARVARAQAALLALNERGRGKRRRDNPQRLWEKVSAILQRHQVAGLIQVSCQEQTGERAVRRWRDRPARGVIERDQYLSVTVDTPALEAVVRRLGWRVYATNAPGEHLPPETVVSTYRGQVVIERGIGRLKGRPLSLTPLYLQKEERVVGLIRLLSLALRVLTLGEYVVRENLAAEAEPLAGLYAGQPKRATAKPTTELLLRAFRGINLVLWAAEEACTGQLPPLTPLQERLLRLWGLPRDTYTRLTLAATHPHPLSGYPALYESLHPSPE
jgi:transposase